MLLGFLIGVGIFSGFVSLIVVMFLRDDFIWGSNKPLLWLPPLAMLLCIVAAITAYHVHWTTRYAQEIAIMDARYGARNVVDVIDLRASGSYEGWRVVEVVLRGKRSTSYDRTLQLWVDPSNGGVMMWW